MSNEDSSPKYFISFVSGIGLGIILTNWYYSMSNSKHKESISVKITNKDGKSIKALYHYNKTHNTIDFQKNLDNVNIEIIVFGKKKTFIGFSGSEIKLL